MKNPLNYLMTPVILLVLTTFTGCEGNGNAEATRELAAADSLREGTVLPNGELALNLCPDVVETGDAAVGVSNAYNWIQKSPDTRFDTLQEMIGDASLNQLYESMVADHPDHDCEGFFTGLKICVGLHGTALRLYYVPAWFCTNQMVGPLDTVEFTTTNATDTLISEAGTFGDATLAAEAIAEYQQNVVFNEVSGTRTFNPSGDETGDTRCVLVPFQLIKTLMEQNGHYVFHIWHYAVKPDYALPDAQIRQSLLLGPEGIVPQQLPELIKQGKARSLYFSASFAGKYADRSHLCPPSCNKVSFVISSGSNDCQ